MLTFSLYFWVLRRGSPVALSLMAYVTPAIALLIGAVLGEEKVTLWTIGVFPANWTLPFDTYYTAFFGNLVMFVVGYVLATWLPQRERDLSDLTLWRRSKPR